MKIKPGHLELERTHRNLPETASFDIVSKDCFEKVKKWLGFDVFGGIEYYTYKGRIVSKKG